MDEPTAISESELQAYVDGRLAPERRAAVEAWLEANPEDRERVIAFQRISRDLRASFDPLLAEPVPERLLLAARRRQARSWKPFAFAAAWTAMSIAVGAVLGWQLHAHRAPVASGAAAGDVATMARRAAMAHVVYSPEVRHPVEVGADQEQHLVTWLSKRLGVNVKAPKLEPAGLSLVGGRLLPGDTGPVAQFMYQTSGGRRLTLYVRSEAKQNRETAFRFVREKNVSVFYWIDQDCGYAIASSDMEKDELLRVANLVYKELER